VENNVALTDDEISLIQTSLYATLASYQKMKSSRSILLDWQTEQTIKDMKALYDRLNNEYFD